MINDKKILAVISARGGSKGVPRKNIRNLAGKPLIAWTIEAAKESKYIDRLILSSEDEEIIEIAREYSCEVPFKRPSMLSEDTTPGIEPILHALTEIPNYDYVMLLQPTSPLRIVADIDTCIEKIHEHKAKACVSVSEANDSPYWMYEILDHKLEPIISKDTLIPRRQELPSVYSLNGAIYIAEIEWLLNSRTFITNETIAYNMPNKRAKDIDTEEDFVVCEYILRNR
ncbi:acylneuraminate cytidylyltransferase family protein [Sporosarcina gallistercoris]|uniref:Acylneuraminate cytidylyltransferase family protein n=1 Tax=Sporosarcina gallistercoris TaxID=2762245 RepID=A0ABR8PN50_9BACL|nr:acylneuraminate cytidylyltransferase family protein [Sporosarcina gallistercoris]MBD7909619.1 acylneuraminate cytidylyltransferase family protein [Sporosarcina gallistercoris]